MDEAGVVIVSGGMDSVTLAHLLAPNVEKLHVVSFDYGQRHWKELKFAERCARRLYANFIHIGLSSLGFHLGSALTRPDIDVPEGHYADESMKATVVPNRNAIMLSIATGIAVDVGARWVATGVHAGDHPIYPDCRPQFIHLMNHAMNAGVEGMAVDNFVIRADFMDSTKADIVMLGETIGVPWDQTWSCYQGGERHCGRCGTCVERREAFELAGVKDPTEYE